MPMRLVQPLLLCCGFFFGASLFAQNEEKPLLLLTPKDSLLLVVVEGKKFLLHPVKPKHTLFSIAKYYALGLEELYEYNPEFRTEPTLKVGTRVKIPIPNKAIKRYKTTGFVASKNIPIYYVVKEKDNLYQICERYFRMPVDSIKKRNRFKDNTIQKGQHIHMGWMGNEGVLGEWRPPRVVTKADVLKERYAEDKKKHKEHNEQGVCSWQKGSQEKGDLYALHREAAIGTIIMVTNPMFNRTVPAKVIGRIPDGYERKTTLILSPEAVRKLGAKDPQFFVKLKYLK